MSRLLVIGVIAMVLAGIALGLSVVGGPRYARLEAQDQERLSDLRRLATLASCKPGTFEDIDAPGCELMSDTSTLRDPVTDAPYVRRLRPDGLLEVCADFATDPEARRPQYGASYHVDGQTVCLRYRLDKGRWRPA